MEREKMSENILLLLPIILLFVFFSCNKKDKGLEINQLRHIETFNNNWFFCVDSSEIAISEKWYQNGLPVSEKRKVQVPHTWNIEEGLERYFGEAWYEKSFKVSSEWKEKNIRLKFGAIHRNAVIYLNGKKIEEHIGAGYTTFYVDIQDYIVFDRTNLITIKVDNKLTKQSIPYDWAFDWANDGGIIRDVELIVTDKNAIDYVHITPTFEQVQNDYNGVLNLNIKLCKNNTPHQNISFAMKVIEENQKTSAILFNNSINVVKDGDFYTASIDVSGINLWHFDAPNLYNIEFGMYVNGVQTDNYYSITGFKEFISKGSEFYLNGEQVRLPGIEWMPGSNPEKGFAEDYNEIEKMLGLIKESNAVFVRFHWQQDEKVIDWCNRNGILVQEEIPHWQLPNELTDSVKLSIKTHIDEMIRRDYNAPSIFSWGIGNELNGQADIVKSFLLETKNYVQLLDSTRFISYTSNTLHENPAKDATQVGDFLMWNDYQGTWHSQHTDSIGILLDQIHEANPNKPLVIAEFGLCEPQFKGGDERRIRDMNTHIDYYLFREFVAGAIYFSLNDYRTHIGEGGKGKYRQRVHGVTDLLGNTKPSFKILVNHLSPIEILKIEETTDQIILTIECKSTLPKYSVKGYSIVSSETINDIKNRTEHKRIPDLIPGEKVLI